MEDKKDVWEFLVYYQQQKRHHFKEIERYARLLNLQSKR